MLVHICCSVDSHYFLKELHKAYPDENLVGFFYNPNIHPKDEHDLRLQDVRRSCNMLNIKLIEGEYNIESWLHDVKGLENEPEKGNRCNVCFDTRLIKTAELAKHLNIKKFTTTLLSSPMKEQVTLYNQGEQIARDNNLEFIKINVRKNGGVTKQNELAKADNLYRQNYCGCQYALNQQRTKQNKISLEMLSNIGRQIMPGSIEGRHITFKRRDAIERNNAGYILTQQKNLVWRLLYARLWHKRDIISSYICARSSSKKHAKSGNIMWIKPQLSRFHHFFDNIICKFNTAKKIEFLESKEKIYQQNPDILIGYSKRDDSIFLDITTLNFFLNTNYNNVKDMIANPPLYNQELTMRYVLCGMESINPIIIIDSKILHDIIIDINGIMQDENIYTLSEEIAYDKENNYLMLS